MQVTYKLTKTRGVQTKMSPHTKANSPQSMALRRATCVQVYLRLWMWCEQHRAFGSYSLLRRGMLIIVRKKSLKIYIKKKNFIDQYWETQEAAGTTRSGKYSFMQRNLCSFFSGITDPCLIIIQVPHSCAWVHVILIYYFLDFGHNEKERVRWRI